MSGAEHLAQPPAGLLHARVTRVVPLEDGVRLELELEHGQLYTVAPLPAPRVGDTVAVRVLGGVRFPKSELPAAVPPQATDPGRKLDASTHE